MSSSETFKQEQPEFQTSPNFEFWRRVGLIIGTVPQLTTAIWVGRDDNKQLARRATGGGMVAPIWRDFMEKALQDVPIEKFQPVSKFSRPQPIKNNKPRRLRKRLSAPKT